MQENCICVRNVAKSFNGRKVVNDLSFEVIDAYLLDETASLSTPVLIKTLPACKVAASEKIIDSYDCNHIHGVAGNYVEEIRHFCELKGIEFNYIH